MKETLFPARLIYVIPIFASILGPISGNTRFWTNDDVGNMLALSGGFSGTPEFKVYVLGPITGLLISALYRVTTSLPWYPILLIVVPLLGALFLLKELRRLVPKFAFFGFGLFFVFPMFLIGSMINYTFSSFVGCSLAITLLMIRINKKGLSPKALILPLVLITISLGFRTSWPTGVFGFPPPGFAFASILGVVLFILVGKSRRELILLLGLLFSVYLVALIPQHAVLRLDQDWSDYISFAEARGNLNGTQPFDLLYGRSKSDYLFLGEVKTKTEVDSFGLSEIADWHLYDATSVSTEGLIALQKLALKEYSNRFGFLDRTMLIVKEGVNFVSFQPFSLCILLAALVVSVSFSRKRLIQKIIIQCSLMIICSALVVGFVLANKRTPDYVVAGCFFCLALTLLMMLIFDESHSESLTKNDSLAKIAFATIVAFSSLTAFSEFLIFPNSQNLENSAIARAKIRDSSKFFTPVVHEVMTVGLAYENTPFDVSITREFAASMDFSGGTFLRSPQSLDRWNRITGESQTVKSLFASDIYERVLLEPWFAVSISNMIFQHRGKCLTKTLTEYSNFVRLQKVSPAYCNIRLIESGTGKNVNDVFSGLEGFDIEVVAQDVSKLEILLLSPFGEYAKLHEARVQFYESANGKYREQVVIVDPATKNRITFNSLKAGDRIRIMSKSPCVIPYELDASRFPDRSVKCVGIESSNINGEIVWTKDLIGS